MRHVNTSTGWGYVFAFSGITLWLLVEFISNAITRVFL